MLFQLTRPLRGATTESRPQSGTSTFQLTRPLRGATHLLTQSFLSQEISTHTPLAGRDRKRAGNGRLVSHFNSHAPCGARHSRTPRHRRSVDFNSHAPCGARHIPTAGFEVFMNFNSHAPCGARLMIHKSSMVVWEFQLTRPLRGATPEFVPNGSRRHKMRTLYYPISRKIPFFRLFSPIFSREPLRNSISPAVRVILSARLRGHRFPLRRYVQFYSSNYSQDNKSSNCPVPDLSA